MKPVDRNIRQSIAIAMKKNTSFNWGEVLGYTCQQLREHIEKEFSKGMTWNNYGEWVVSFHVPRRCYTFNSIRDIDFKNFWSLKNLTPRWKNDAQHQKKQIDIDEVNKYGLWDILPIGNISQYLTRTKKNT